MASKNAWARKAWRKAPFTFLFLVLPNLYRLWGWRGVRNGIGIFLGAYE